MVHPFYLSEFRCVFIYFTAETKRNVGDAVPYKKLFKQFSAINNSVNKLNLAVGSRAKPLSWGGGGVEEGIKINRKPAFRLSITKCGSIKNHLNTARGKSKSPSKCVFASFLCTGRKEVP